jgi:RND family efflux transporter MFP subunit
MRAAVDEEDKVQVQPNQAVRMMLYSFPDRPFHGTVAKVYDKADPDRRTFEVDVRVDDPDVSLAPGMTGELAFIIRAKDRAPVVPSQAVQGGAIWVVRDGQLARTDARVGLQSVERAEILSGLHPDDQVVISPIGKMRPGTRVRTTFMDPVVAAGLNKEAEKDTFKGFN